MPRDRRPLRRWLLAAGVAITAAGGLTAAQTPVPPKLLADVLRARPEWRLLDPATDLAGDYTVAQLEALDRWPPWIGLDFDRDGRDDIAAVVVRRGTAREPEFTVVVVHGATPDHAVLVVPFRPQRIFGVSEGIKDDTVMPLYCADCDANVWYRWNGRAYEPRLHAVGESIRIRRRTRAALDALHRSASRRGPDRRGPAVRPGAGAGGRRRTEPALVPRGRRGAVVPEGVGPAAARDGRRGVRGLAVRASTGRLIALPARPGGR